MKPHPPVTSIFFNCRTPLGAVSGGQPTYVEMVPPPGARDAPAAMRRWHRHKIVGQNIDLGRNTLRQAKFATEVHTCSNAREIWMRIAMIGAGYVGLTSGACFAQLGHAVTCIDIDKDRISELQAGRLPIFEPGLQEIVARKTRQHRLRFSSDIAAGCRDADAIFLAVGTPSRPDG